MQVPPTSNPLRVLVFGAHADDIEIGAAGTLLTIQESRPVVGLAVVFSGTDDRKREAEHSASLLFEAAVDWSVDVRSFQENLFPDHVAELKASMAAIRTFDPDLVFTHRLTDRHQDHRTIAELTWQAFRDHTVLQYEIPKWEGDLTTPNVYVPLSDATLERKINIIEESFVSQRDKPWFDADTLRAVARLRGVECGQRWAEGFHADKVLLRVEEGSPL